MGVRVKLLLLIGLLLIVSVGSAQAQGESSGSVVIYIFRGEGCPYCRAEMEYLTALEEFYPQITVRDYEVFYHEENRIYMIEMLAKHGVEPNGVPATFIHDRYWVGFNENIAREIETTAVGCLRAACVDPGVGVFPVEENTSTVTAPVDAAIIASPEENTLTLPLVGEISLAGLSLGVSTALIAFVDGFNPCSLWVLSLLLALVLHSGSRKKVVIVGLTFLTVAAAVYVVFIAGLFSIFSFVGFMGWIQAAVALLALTFAVINIKDYFWFKQGVSLTISDKHKPKMYRDMRGLLTGNQSTLALMGATAVMAMGITLVELPCTSGLPILWTNLITAQEVPTFTFILLLGLYMLIFLADELIVFFSVVFTLKASKFEEKQGRLLKLIGGMVMFVLAIVLLIDPAIMNDLTNSLIVFGVALLAAAVVLVLHRRILPHYGIFIGTENLGGLRHHHKGSH